MVVVKEFLKTKIKEAKNGNERRTLTLNRTSELRKWSLKIRSGAESRAINCL